MYSAIIVDDEPNIRNGLRTIIDWEASDFTIVGEAEDGQSALELYKTCSPDLVVTDIKMPIMSGLVLAKKVKEINSDTQIIILSGYDDFLYAKEAIKFDVKNYLLKPVDTDELIESLNKIRKLIIDKKQQALAFLSQYHYIKDIWSLENKTEGIINALSNGDKSLALEEVDIFFDYCKNNNVSLAVVKDLLVFIMVQIGRIVTKNNGDWVALYNDKFSDFEKNINKMQNISDQNMISCVKEISENLTEHMINKDKNSNLNMDDITKYIKDNLHEKLSLKKLGGIFYQNPVYLGQLFKKNTGYYFNDYVNLQRINKSIVLLKNTDLSMNEIAINVGYKYTDHFYRNFQKICNCNPGDYRTV